MTHDTLGKVNFDSGVGKQSPSNGAWAFCAKIAVPLIVIGLLLFYDFVFGQKTLLFSGVGGDSLDDYFPTYALLSDCLRHGKIPSWSFRVGMGQDMFAYIGSILVFPVVWLSKWTIAQALVYQHLGYIVIAGMAFARFLCNRGLSFKSCLLGALLLSFSAYMCAGSCWYPLAAEVVCMALLLLACELAITGGSWLYISLAVLIVGCLGSFYLYLGALLLCFYTPFRLLERYSWWPIALARTCILLALGALLGLGLSAIASLDNFYMLANSSRGSGLNSMFKGLYSSSVFGFDAPISYITSALRPFSNDMAGTENDFRGWYNYFEAPMSYCGLLCLLIFPQVFIGATWRQRVLYAVFSAAIAVPITFPWFRYLFWGFQGEYFRTLSLFSAFGIIAFSMTAFSRYGEGRPFSLWVLGATTLALLGILYFPLKEAQAVINSTLRIPVTIFLSLYLILLAIGQVLRRQKIAAWAIICLTAIELFYINRINISARHSITKPELKERVGYNDVTVDVLRDINALDQTFFRVTKTWGSSASHVFPSLNDGMVFGYYGTSCYSSFNNVNYMNFLIALDTIPPGKVDAAAFWSTGLLGHSLLSTFACEKYVLAAGLKPYPTADYYELVKRYEDIYLLRNQMFLPLGLTFSRYLPEETFRQMPTSAKPLALLHTAVLADETAALRYGLLQWSLPELQQQINETSLPDAVALRRNSALAIQSFSDTRIDGTVHLDQKGILILQTPFDRGWRAFQDGRDAPVLKVDVGLLGVVLDSGEHQIELRYRPPMLLTGAAVSLASLLIFAFCLWRWPRVRLPA